MTSSKLGLRIVTAHPGTGDWRMAARRLLRLLTTIGLLGLPPLAVAGTWQTLKNPPPIPEIIDPATNEDFGPGGAAAPLLLTDGGVLIQNNGPLGEDGKIFKLTPDIHGSYVNGTWTQLAS